MPNWVGIPDLNSRHPCMDIGLSLQDQSIGIVSFTTKDNKIASEVYQDQKIGESLDIIKIMGRPLLKTDPKAQTY